MMNRSPNIDAFFVGVPAPAAAALALMPLLISFDTPELTFVRSHAFCGTLLCVVSFLMVSRIPTFSTKHLRVTKSGLIFLMIVVALFVSSLMTQPWFTLGFATFYALSIPYGVVVFSGKEKIPGRKRRRSIKNERLFKRAAFISDIFIFSC